MADFIFSAGVRFNPRDIDTRAITDAITQAVSDAKIRISKITLDKGSITKEVQAALDSVKLKLNSSNIEVSSSALSSKIQRAIDLASKGQALKLSIDKEFLKKQIQEVARIEPAQVSRATPGAGGVPKVDDIRKSLDATKQVVEQLERTKAQVKEISDTDISMKLQRAAGTLKPTTIGATQAISAVKQLEKEFLKSSSTIREKLEPSISAFAQRVIKTPKDVKEITKEAEALRRTIQEVQAPEIRAESITAGLRRAASSLRPDQIGTTEAISAVKQLEKEFLKSSNTVRSKVVPAISALAERINSTPQDVAAITAEANKLRESIERIRAPELRTQKIEDQLRKASSALSPDQFGATRAIASIKQLENELLKASSTVRTRMQPAIDAFAATVSRSPRDVQRITAEAEKLRASLERVRLPQLREQAIQQGVERFRLANDTLVRYNEVVTPAERATRNFNAILAQGGTSAQGFGAKIAQVTTRFAAYLVSIRALFAVQQAFNQSLRVIVDFDNVLQDLQKVLQSTPAELQEVTNSIFGIARATSRSFQEVGVALNNFIRQGIGVEEALKRTQQALIAVNVTELDAADATRFLTSAVRIFANEIRDGTQATDILVTTADNAATTAGEVGTAFLRSASSAQEAGVSFRELNAIIAATIEQTQLGGAQIGTALKTIFTRIISNADALRQQANALGANIRPGEDVVTVLRELATIFPNLNKEQRNQLGLLVAGRRQANIFAGIIGSLGKAEQLLVKQLDSAGAAAAKNEIELQKLSAQGRLLSTTISELVVNIAGLGEGAEGAGGLRATFVDILQTLNALASASNELITNIKSVNVLGVDLTSILTGVGKTVFFASAGLIIRGIISGVRQFLQLGTQLRAIFQQIGSSQQLLNTLISRQNGALRQSNTLEKERLGLLQQISQQEERISRSKTSSLTSQRSQRREAGGGLSDTQRGIARAGLVTAAVAGIQIISDVFRNSVRSFREANDGAASLGSVFLETSASAASVGTSIALLAGPIPGLIAALSAFTASLVRNGLELKIGTDNIRRFVELEASQRVDLAAAFAQGGELLANVVKEFESKEVQTSLAFNLALTNLTGSLETASQSVTRTFNNITAELARAVRSAEIRSAINEFTNQLRTQEVSLDLQIQAGGGGAGVEQFAGLIAEVRTTVEQTSGELESQTQVFERLVQANRILNTLEEQRGLSSRQVLTLFGSLNEETRLFVQAQRNAEQELVNLDATLNKIIPGAEELVGGAQDFIDALRQGEAEVQGNKQAIDALKGTQEGLNILEQLSLDRQKELNNVLNGRAAIQSKLIEFEAEVNKRAEGQKKLIIEQRQEFEKLVQSTANFARQQQLIALQSAQQSTNLQEQLELGRRQFQQQAGGLSSQAQLQQLQERLEQRRIQTLRTIQIEQSRSLGLLQQQLEAAEAANATEEAAALGGAIDQLSSGFAQRLNEELGRLEVEAQLEIESFVQDQIRNAEQALSNFRINEIQRVVDSERSAAEARIDQIRRVSQFSGSNDILERQLRGVNDSIIRFFGGTEAAVMAEQDKIFNSRINQIRAQEQEILQARIAPLERLEQLQRVRGEAINEIEERNAQIRQSIVSRLEEVSMKVVEAEKALIEERNKIPALNSQIIQAQKSLNQAQSAVSDATDSLFDAFQQAADAQVQYQFAVADARAQVLLATGGLVGFSMQINEINNIGEAAFEGIRASEEQIFQIRSRLAQQALSIFQNQFNAIQSLGQQAATASLDQFQEIQQGAAIASEIIANQSAAGFSSEQLELANALSSAVPGLERLISEEGLRRLGVDAQVLQNVEDRMLELAEVTADSSRSQLEAANEQIRAANEQIRVAQEQVEQQKQQLQIANEQRSAQLQQTATAQSNLSSLRVGFSRLQSEGNRRLQQLASLGNLTQITNNLLTSINSNIGSLVGELRAIVANANQPVSNIPNNARGSLNSGEINGLIRAARREKAAMPAGSRLMLANTSEVVLTKRQAGSMGLQPTPKRFAQDGNAAPSIDITQLANAINNLVARVNTGGLIDQNINVRLDQERTINLRGVDNISQALKQEFERQMARVPDKQEFNAIADLVSGVVSRLREQGQINLLGE